MSTDTDPTPEMNIEADTVVMTTTQYASVVLALHSAYANLSATANAWSKLARRDVERVLRNLGELK